MRDGTYESSNYGNSTSLTVKKSSTGLTRQAYLKFDLRYLGGAPVAEASLNLWVSTVGVDARRFDLRELNSDEWSENTITFANRPTASDVFAANYQSMSDGMDLSFDITPYVNKAILGDGYLSLRLQAPDDTGAEGWVNFGSSERSNFRERPYLALVGAGSIEPVADTFVNDGTSASTNYGSREYLNLKTTTAQNSNYNREILLRFDPSVRNRPVSTAKMRLVPYNVGSTVGWHSAYDLIEGTDWEEGEVTWNTRPPTSPSYYLGANFPVENGMPIELDITHRVNQAIAESRPMTIKVRLTSDTGEKGFVSYRSREYADSAVRPVLVLVE